MPDLFNNVKYYNSLSGEGRREFIDKLYQMLLADGSNPVDYQKLKQQSRITLCPRCGSENIIKAGTRKGRQIYRCKSCKHQFSFTAGTFVYRLRKPSAMLDYIRCMLEGKSLRACAEEVGICLKTSFLWRHRILSALESLDEDIKFSGIIETDELVLKQNKHNAHILLVADREGNVYAKYMGDKAITSVEINNELKNKIDSLTVCCVKDSKKFRDIRKYDIKKTIVIKNKKVKRDIYHLEIVKNEEDNLKKLLTQYKNISPKYLQGYLKFYVLKNNYLSGNVDADVGRLLNIASSAFIPPKHYEKSKNNNKEE
ncbi:MAG TPA: IS1595 family transposase [Bacteroidales bacterium]|nr:IS1595 family transposase [Bacteroidales bacterium]HPL02332.1 IS1595 family transposase [Bacteroidales bacterium]HRR52333.1 IS1595 family transposase [Bacteroidales bacterium]HRS68976.1 IS1595 family transposase [Bacteroidales bacterium]HRT72334.1 IS1595 family transposase [Bacteroidales bacterium]